MTSPRHSMSLTTDTDDSSIEKEHNSADEKYLTDFEHAYYFAYSKWITTKETIQEARIDANLTRIAMAKMLSSYAINVLWQTPDTTKWTVEFDDIIEEKNQEYNDVVNLAYQLWIMGINMKDNNFRPYGEVTRAQFVTALSRMLYKIKDGDDKNYYLPHMAKLYHEWVINKLDPLLKEKRWYAMLMLMRVDR